MAAFTGWAPQQKGIILDGCAGPGGWSEGIRRWLGLHDVGLEWGEAACQTRAAAGHVTIRADVSCFVLGPVVGKVWGLLFSPPCTKFSTAGKGFGRLVNEPAATLAFGHARNEYLFTDGETSRMLTIPEGSVLQSFPADHPFKGTKTAIFTQIGNAVPCLLAAHVVSAASGVPFLQEALAQAA
jgi:site-specific DNA-cytosine methylase